MLSLVARRACAAAVAASIAVAALGAARADATRLGWHEIESDGKVPVLSFTVYSLTFGKQSWTARVEVKNLSKRTVLIGDEFGVFIFAHPGTTNPSKVIALGKATIFVPRHPTKLKPGAAWNGTIGGLGKPRPATSERWARLVFGPFTNVVGQQRPILWVTNHSLPLRPKPKPPPSKLVA